MSVSSTATSPTPPPLCAVCGTALTGTGTQCLRCLLSLGSDSGLKDVSDEMPEGLLEPLQVRQFGDFELLEEIARGGMGVVYRARQRSLRREVAVKMMLAGELAGLEARRMFQTEALAAAALHHPNIVPVFEAGEFETQPFISMRYVPGGRNISAWAAERRAASAWKAIAGAAAQVARAVAHAHERGVLHRDLKPSNILWDNEAGPQVTDFGLAKLLTAAGEGLTVSVHMLGSPGYMAPEQTGGQEQEITTATDVYGLGAVLYELSSGRPPFLGKSALETTRMVMEETPPPLKNVPRDLATVCQKCLARRPRDRYPSATAVAEELERFSRGEPVLAVPLPLFPRLWRWALRRPAIAALLALSTGAVVAGVGGVFWQWRKAENARAAQSVSLEEAKKASAAQAAALDHLRWQEMDGFLVQGDPARALARAAAFVREKPDDWRAVMFAMSIVDQNSFPVLTAPEIETLTGKGVAARMSPDGKWVVHAAVDATVRVFHAATGRQAAVFKQIPQSSGKRSEGDAEPPARDLTAIAIGQGPLPLAVASAEGQVTLRPLPEGPLVALKGLTSSSRIWELSFSSDGAKLLGRSSNSLCIWNTAEPEAGPLSKSLGEGLTGAAISGDGGSVFAWNKERAVVWDTATGAERLTINPDANPEFGAISADGTHVAISTGTRTVSVWDVASRKLLTEKGKLAAGFVALNTDGSRLLTGGNGIPLAVYDTASSLRVSGDMWTHKVTDQHNLRFPLPLPWFAVSMDGRRFASTGLDETVCLWEAGSGRMVGAPVRLGTGMDYPTMQLSPDGSRLLTHHRVFRDGKPQGAELGLWKMTPVRVPLREDHPGGMVSGAVISPNGKLGATAFVTLSVPQKFGVRVTEFSSGKTLLDAPCAGQPKIPMFSSDSRTLYALPSEGTVNTLAAWSLESGKELWKVELGGGDIVAAAISPDGAWIASGINDPATNDGNLIISSTADGRKAQEIALGGIALVVRFAPDGSNRLLTAGGRGSPRLWDVVSGRLLRTFTGPSQSFVTAASWSADAKLLAMAQQSQVRVWDVGTGQERYAPLEHAAWLSHLEFSPDGLSLATACRDGTLRVWDARTGHPLCSPRHQGNSCETVRFAPDGASFVVVDTTGFRFWDTSRVEPATVHFPAPFGGIGTSDCPSHRNVLSPDGSMVFTGALSSCSALWAVEKPSGPAPAWFPDLLEALALMRMDASGTVALVPGRMILRVKEEISRAPAGDPFARWAGRVLQ